MTSKRIEYEGYTIRVDYPVQLWKDPPWWEMLFRRGHKWLYRKECCKGAWVALKEVPGSALWQREVHRCKYHSDSAFVDAIRTAVESAKRRVRRMRDDRSDAERLLDTALPEASTHKEPPEPSEFDTGQAASGTGG